MVSREEVPRGWGAGDAHSYELLESDQHSEICSEPLIFSWFVINCTLYIVVYRGGRGSGGVQLTTNSKVSPAQQNLMSTSIFLLVNVKCTVNYEPGEI